MDQKAKSGASVDVDPKTELVMEDDRDTLLVHLPGFAKEQLRLQLTPARTLKITGERLLADNQRLLVKKEYPVSTECDARKISARFEDGILYITQPKSAQASSLVAGVKEEKKGKPGLEETNKAVSSTTTTEAQKPGQQPPANDQPPPQKPDQKPTYDDPPRPQQTTTDDQKMKPMVDQSKQLKEEMKSESVDAKGDLGREKGEEEEEGKRTGKIRDKGEGLGSCGFAGGVAPPVVGMWRRPLGKVISLVVGVFLVLVIGIFYARNWNKALPWNMENES